MGWAIRNFGTYRKSTQSNHRQRIKHISIRNGTIILEDGTYNEYNIPIDTDTTIIGESSIGTIINAQTLGNIFTVTPDNRINLTLINMTLENSNAPNNGGAIEYENDKGYYGT